MTRMADAGLTNGAFYAHFEAKDDLVATAVADQLRALNANVVTQAAPGIVGLKRSCGISVAPAPRQPRRGLPLRRTPRRDRAVRGAAKQAYTDGVLAVTDSIAERLAPAVPRSVRKRPSASTPVVGTLQLSRALAYRQLSDELLDEGIHNALTALGIAESR